MWRYWSDGQGSVLQKWLRSRGIFRRDTRIILKARTGYFWLKRSKVACFVATNGHQYANTKWVWSSCHDQIEVLWIRWKWANQTSLLLPFIVLEESYVFAFKWRAATWLLLAKAVASQRVLISNTTTEHPMSIEDNEYQNVSKMIKKYIQQTY